MNNYEKIKQMSVDEMAKLFNIYFSCSRDCEFYNLKECSDENCITHIKQWLLSESEEV